jgi:hypothetical protein
MVRNLYNPVHQAETLYGKGFQLFCLNSTNNKFLYLATEISFKDFN